MMNVSEGVCPECEKVVYRWYVKMHGICPGCGQSLTEAALLESPQLQSVAPASTGDSVAAAT